jgi:hypothetical protein
MPNLWGDNKDLLDCIDCFPLLLSPSKPEEETETMPPPKHTKSVCQTMEIVEGEAKLRCNNLGSFSWHSPNQG